MRCRIAIGCLSLLCACSLDLSRDPPDGGDGGGSNNSGTDSDINPPVDVTNPDSDGLTPPVDSRPDLGPMPTTSVLQVVASKLMLPDGGAKYALDLDGNGSTDNKLGEILGAVNLALPDAFASLQESVDNSIAEGDTILLLDLLADNLTTSLARVRAHLGEDLDGNPADNFSGTEPFRPSGASPKDTALDGQLQDGNLDASGSVLVPLSLAAGTTVVIPLQKARIQATVTESGIKGMVGGAASMTDVENTVVKEIAIRLDEVYNAPDITPDNKKQLEPFDTDKNGTISAADLMSNSLVALLVKPDVDTDGDKKVDAMSVGIGFESVPCTIQDQ